MTQAAAAIKPSPTDVRDALVQDYAESCRKAGADVSIGDVERIAQEDLRVYEAVERERKDAPQAKAAPVADERVDTAALKARELGMELVRTPIDKAVDRFDPVLDADPRKLGQKFPAMMGRIKRIFEARGDTRQATLAKSLEEVAAPKLAREFMSLLVFWKAPYLKMKANPFYEVEAPRDRARILLRKIEDICDRSTGAMGPWWVK